MMLVPASLFLITPALAQQNSTLAVSTSLSGLKDLPLKAIQDSDGDINTQNNFEIQPDDLVTVQKSADFHVLPDGGEILAVKITDAQLQTTDLPFSESDGRVNQNLAAGSYLLDVIILMDNDDKYLYETALAVLEPGQTLSQTNIQNIVQNFVTTVSNTDTKIIFRDDNDDEDDDEEEPSICFFDPNDEECDPNENGDCAEGFGHNEDGRCIPSQRCPEGFHRANDDESGRCIPEDELRECENNGGWVEEGEFCPEDELPFCNEDRSNEPCISGQGEEAAAQQSNNDTSTQEEQEDEPLDSNCGGVPCTASEKEDSWLSDVPESSPGVPIEPQQEDEPEEETTDSEETVAEIEEGEEESESDTDSESNE
jgi:hypothetical protein